MSATVPSNVAYGLSLASCFMGAVIGIPVGGELIGGTFGQVVGGVGGFVAGGMAANVMIPR